MSGNVDSSPNLRRSLLVRAAEFLAFWVILFGLNPRALFVGIFVTVITTWVSLRLLPPGLRSFRPIPLMQLVLSLLAQSIGAGVDVALRALDPRLPLRPGFLIYRTCLPSGLTQHAFCTMTSLLPGTLPCEADESGNVVIHCLDVAQPVAEQLAAQEAALARTIGGRHRDA